jgi:hypothetical protein
VPPPRIHLHRYFGVLAPRSPMCSAVTALAPAATNSPPAPQPAAEPAHRRAARGPPRWNLSDAGPGSFDPQPAPEYEFDQRVTW